jgi:CUB domain
LTIEIDVGNDFNAIYLASPNYPDRYYMQANCRWMVHARPWQTIQVIVHDFELDVRRGGRCHDYVIIASKPGDFSKFMRNSSLKLLSEMRGLSTKCFIHSGRFGAAIPTIYTQASPNLNGLNPNVTVGRNSVGIAAPGDNGP